MSKFVTVDGKKMHYNTAGSGPPLIMLHGGGPGASGMSNFQRNFEPLSANNRVYVVDLPGYGKSENTDATGDLFKVNADAMFGFMRELGIDKADFLGNSMGGATALELAIKDPVKVDRLVLMGPAGSLPMFTPTPTEGQRRIIEFYKGNGSSPEKLRSIMECLVYDPTQISDEMVNERFRVATRPEVLAKPPINRRNNDKPGRDLWATPLTELDHKILIIWGREDRVTPVDGALILLRTLKNAELHIFPKCGHWAQWEKANEFNNLVRTFLHGN